MNRQEQYDKLQEACKLLHNARRLIREARAGGDISQLPIFGAMQTATSKAYDAVELLSESCHTIRSFHPIKAP